jgi:hypothetical protein
MSLGRPQARRGLAAVFTTLLLLGGSTARATTMQRLDTRALTIQSQEIVVGQVEQVSSYWNASHTKILTDVTVRVTQSLKGGSASRVVLTQFGGELDGVRYSIPGCPAFSPGEEALFFVWHDPRGRAQVNGLAQGKFDIQRDPVSGEQLVQRTVPGFAVRDAKSLKALSAGQVAPRIQLRDLIHEIQRTLAEEAGR